MYVTEYLNTLSSFESYLNFIDDPEMWSYKFRIAREVDNNDKVLLVAPRQIGMSTFLHQYVRWYASRLSDQVIIFVTDYQRYTNYEISSGAGLCRNVVPIRNRESLIEYSNDSKIVIRAPNTTFNGYRAPDLVVVDLYSRGSSTLDTLIQISKKSIVFSWPHISGGVYERTRNSHTLCQVQLEESMYWSPTWERQKLGLLGQERFNAEYRPVAW